MNRDTNNRGLTTKQAWTRGGSLLGLLLVVVAAVVGVQGQGEDLRNSTAMRRTDERGGAPAFNDQGQLLRPEDYREWVFIGAPVTPNDMNDGRAAFPEFHNVYIDPTSFASFQRTGEFRDGTMIVKELVSVGGKEMLSGSGYFQGNFVSLEAMVKDRRRFDDEPGGWAFFRFGEAPDYEPVGARMETASCNACHAAADQDHVFTSTYPVLRAAKPMTTN